MTVEIITTILMIATPIILNIVAIITAVCGFGKKVAELKGEIVKTKEYDSLKEELQVCYKALYDVTLKLNELLAQKESAITEEVASIKAELKVLSNKINKLSRPA